MERLNTHLEKNSMIELGKPSLMNSMQSTMYQITPVIKPRQKSLCLAEASQETCSIIEG